MSGKFEISRVFGASRERVWDAWTKPEQLSHWLAPKGTTSEVKHFELKPGGYLHSKLTGSDGSISWGKTVYREIDPHRRLYGSRVSPMKPATSYPHRSPCRGLARC